MLHDYLAGQSNLLSSFRNAVPPIRFFRRWVGLDPVPIIKKLDKTESHLEKIKKDHKENIEGLREKLCRRIGAEKK